ncbi:putative restriction endonuclease [Chitinophaga sp. YR573]|uniref:YDG/SRA domain-containing protein n=1 Tax=Chitinophaga sp. YR573 TaxID=1881040 RepID=UPI0008B7BA9A|nr:YDG/SRA domain-containing protein [Chitinophaga sp. YR573]SEW35226.1 putative restriction endonuclease [Chitinophaga sp. YR573]
MRKPIIFGEILDIGEGHWFKDRKEMMLSSFHRNWGAGIDGNAKEGVAAIVLSGGYEDDEDLGDEIIYTGAGGNDPNTRKQIKDQTWDKGNAGLRLSMDQGLPVRVIRGYSHKSEFSPATGYTYAGLYSVVDSWEENGKSGFKICRFRLEYCGKNKERNLPETLELRYSKREKQRKEGTILRIIRDTKIVRDIKKLYNYECQVCRHTINTRSGRYAEGAHVKPLGNPHDGDDSIDNIICLCPNHHVMFDKGSFSINDNLELIGILEGKLFFHKQHYLNKSNLEYHRKSHGYN